jgi:hypothetical protein
MRSIDDMAALLDQWVVPRTIPAATGAPCAGARRGRRLREVVADVAEDVRDLVAKEDHGNDDRDRNDRDDECIFDQALTVLFTGELPKIHICSFPSLSISVARC